jgi:glycosyl transferase family 25
MRFHSYYLPIYVLSLLGDEERRQPLLSSLDVLKVRYKVILGVDGRRGLPSEFEAEINRAAAEARHGRQLTDGEFACALSHRKIYQSILDENLLGALILEDDIIVDGRLIEFLQTRTYERADLVMLDHSHARVRGKSCEVIPGVQLARLSLPSCRTSAYSVTAKAAAYLVRVSSPISSQADWPGDITTLGAAALDPRIVERPVEESSHLQVDRKIAASIAQNDLFFQAWRRLFSTSFWRRWFIKRRSRRIS